MAFESPLVRRPPANGAPGSTEVIGIGYSNGNAGTSVEINKTYQQIIGSLSKPIAVRIEYTNYTTTAYTVDKTSITASDSFVAGSAASGGSTPVNVLFGGAASIVVPAGTGTDHASVFSDWMTIPAIERVDGGSHYLYHIRSFIANAGTTAYPKWGQSTYRASGDDTAYPGNNVLGRPWSLGRDNGDKILTPTALWPTDADNGVSIPLNIYFKTAARSFTVVSVGDSITGANSSGTKGGSIFSIIDQAIITLNSSTPSYGVTFSHLNCGFSGQSIPLILTRLTGILSRVKPNIVILPVCSPNGMATTQDAANSTINSVLTAVDEIRAAGAFPILVTCTPNNAFSATQDSLRIFINSWWAKAAESGAYLLADCASAVEGGVNGSNVRQWATGYSGDGLHPNAAGQAAMAPAIANALRRSRVWL